MPRAFTSLGFYVYIGITLSDYNVTQVLPLCNMGNFIKNNFCICTKHRNAHKKDTHILTAPSARAIMEMLGGQEAPILSILPRQDNRKGESL